MTDQEQAIIDAIFVTRVNNNIPWKKLIEIALTHAPREAKEALREISDNDLHISDLTRRLLR
jgi:hypothetical protein